MVAFSFLSIEKQKKLLFYGFQFHTIWRGENPLLLMGIFWNDLKKKKKSIFTPLEVTSTTFFKEHYRKIQANFNSRISLGT